MKNKKKPSSQTYPKNQSKHERHEPPVLLRKSPIKHKTTQPKTQTHASLQGGNLAAHQFNKTTLFYGKKYHYGEINPKRAGDSNQSSTHCSFNNRSHKQKVTQTRKNAKSKSLKSIKNNELRHQQIQEEDEVQIKLSSNQIMELINSYAAKIQRQWRLYWFRKCVKFYVLKERESKKFELLNSFYSSEVRSVENCRISYEFQQKIPMGFIEEKDRKRHTLPKLPVTNAMRKSVEHVLPECNLNELDPKRAQQTSNDNQLTEDFYNNKKYASLSSLYSGKLISNVDVSVKNKESQHDRTSSLGQNIQIRQQNSVKLPKMVDIELSCSLNQRTQNYAQFSTPVNGLRQANDTTEKKSSEKKSNIKLETRVYECKIEEVNSHVQSGSLSKPYEQPPCKNLIEEFKRAERPSSPKTKSESSPNAKSNSSLKSKYDTKFPSIQNLEQGPEEMTRIFKKYKKAIEKQGSKKISKIVRHFQQKQITERTYKNLIQETKQKLNKEIKTLELKEGHFQNSWKEIYVMYKDYVRENSFQQGETPRDLQKFKETYHDQHQISFDKWDFESSAKKSISQLQSFQDFARELNERNPQKLKGFFIETKKILIDSKPIELVLDELDRLDNDTHKDNLELSEFREEGGSIYEEFKQRERTNSFQKKHEHVLVENIAQKVSQKVLYADMKSPHVSPCLSPKEASISVKRRHRDMFEDQQNLGDKNEYLEAKRMHIEFSETSMSTPPKSGQRLGLGEQKIKPLKQLDVGQSKMTRHIKTEESDEDSEVEMKVTSINVGQKEVSNKREREEKEWKGQNGLFVPQSHKQKLQNSLLRQLQANKQQQQTDKKIQVEKGQKAIAWVQHIGIRSFEKGILAQISPTITQLSRMMAESHREKQRRKQQQQRQMRKYPQTIDPTIDAINTWLLQISHHLLDHHNAEVRRNLTQIKQVPREQMLQICHSSSLSNSFFQSHSYITITQKIFKQFEFFYLKNVAHNLQIDEQHQQNFEHLLYSFHRCLIDCMNLTLLDELIVGRNWAVIPWVSSFRYKKNQTPEHAKQCLERGINRVSGWAEYSLAQLEENAEMQGNHMEWKQYQEEKMNLVIREEVLEYPLDNEFVLSNLVMNICNMIYQDEILEATQDINAILQKDQS